MIIINVLGGGSFVIDKQLETWSKLYPNVDVAEEISMLNDLGVFKNKTVNGAAKYINRYLKAKEDELNVPMQQL